MIFLIFYLVLNLFFFVVQNKMIVHCKTFDYMNYTDTPKIDQFYQQKEYTEGYFNFIAI